MNYLWSMEKNGRVCWGRRREGWAAISPLCAASRVLSTGNIWNLKFQLETRSVWRSNRSLCEEQHLPGAGRGLNPSSAGALARQRQSCREPGGEQRVERAEDSVAAERAPVRAAPSELPQSPGSLEEGCKCHFWKRSHFVEIPLQLGSRLQQQRFVSSSASCCRQRGGSCWRWQRCCSSGAQGPASPCTQIHLPWNSAHRSALAVTEKGLKALCEVSFANLHQ